MSAVLVGYDMKPMDLNIMRVVGDNAGDKSTRRYGWDRLIWTNEVPYHNVARAFVGSKEVE